MGKRKERRLAAKGASRRVKLDLFAEPSGDLSGSSAQDEVGGDTDSKHHTESPSSPTSPDQQPENPLLLLGQYSDDELDEESSKRLDRVTADNSSAELNGQAASKDGEYVETKTGEDVGAQETQLDGETSTASLEALQKSEDNDASSLGDAGKEVDLMEQTSVPITTDMQVVGDANLGWKIVLHEESNRHYYWNTVTGETSWEVPDVLALGAELTSEQRNASDIEGRENSVLGESGSTVDLALDVELQDSISGAINGLRPQEEAQNERSKREISEDGKEGSGVNGGDAKDFSSAINALYHEISALEGSVSPRQSDDVLLGSKSAVDADSVKYTDDNVAHDEDETGTDISSRLVRHCEYLLERLGSVEGSKYHLQVQEKILKYTVEIEIRLSDINSLLSYGSSLLPFWLHSERQLKQLEATINDVVLECDTLAETTEVETTYHRLESVDDDIKADRYDKKVVCSTPEKSQTSADTGVLMKIHKDSRYATPEYASLSTSYVSSIGHVTTFSASDTREEGEIYDGGLPTGPTPETVLHEDEDVDMDVDMEIEDGMPPDNTTMVLGAQGFTPADRSVQPNPPVEDKPFVADEDFTVPPPPGEEWVPPPPPDNEPVPPPPPDEPPEPSYPPPPSYAETVHPLSFTEQYNISYPGSNFEYYGQTNTEVPGSNFYAHAPLYYEAAPGTYPVGAPVLVNSVGPVAYYDLQDGKVAPQPMVSSAESPALHSESGNDTLSSDFKCAEAKSDANSTLLPNSKVDLSAVGEETLKASIEVKSTPLIVQAPATFSTIESVSLPSTAAVTAAAVAAMSTSGKSKVLRSKKRAAAAVPTLRSNKKVSSLVDKWKAAKEELHEDDEDEPENAYEILEKKRQREIEEWRAQQIASGEAKANANFQPLGSDWRARVKRRRARMTSEAVESPKEGLVDGNQQPDLNELSRDLPSGWQAYWDESSKQVYYGNSITSETTWVRPTS